MPSSPDSRPGTATIWWSTAVGERTSENFGYDLLSGAPAKPPELVMVNPDGSARVVAQGLDFPNGTVVTATAKR